MSDCSVWAVAISSSLIEMLIQFCMHDSDSSIKFFNINISITEDTCCASTRSLNEIELKMKILYIAAVSNAINDSAFCFLLYWLLYLLLATNYYDCGPSDGLRSPPATPNHAAVQELQKIFSINILLSQDNNHQF